MSDPALGHIRIGGAATDSKSVPDRVTRARRAHVTRTCGGPQHEGCGNPGDSAVDFDRAWRKGSNLLAVSTRRRRL